MILDGEDSGEDSDVLTMPKFWIARDLVTEGEFASLMGRPVREGRTPDQPLADIEWEEALKYCDRFTEQYAKQLPDGVVATMPTMLEWAHAVKVLNAPEWLDRDVGSFLFTRSQDGGYLCTPGTFMPFEYDLAGTLVRVAKRATKSHAGLRLALIGLRDRANYVNGEEINNTMVSRGVILLQCGYFEEAKAQLRRVLKEGHPSEEERARAENALAFAEKEHDFRIEDWSGIVALAARKAAAMGFVTAPFTERWMLLGSEEQMESDEIAAEYAARGVVGEWARIGDLPEDVRRDQSVGNTNVILTLTDDGVEKREFPTTLDTRVQTLRCDFTGDGTPDLVVEDFGSVGSLGYWYDFYATQPDGSHVKLESIQTVGLCALPRADGGACGFLVLEKEENPVLCASLLRFAEGRSFSEDLIGDRVVMMDADESSIYVPAPFIGGGYGLGWSMLEGMGVWYRPLFWPWAPGRVQGLEAPATRAD